MGRTVRRQIVRGRNLVGTNCKGRIIGGRSVRGQTVGVPVFLIMLTVILTYIDKSGVSRSRLFA